MNIINSLHSSSIWSRLQRGSLERQRPFCSNMCSGPKVFPHALVYTKLSMRWNWSHTFNSNSERRETLYCSFHSSRRPPGWNWLICYRSELTVPKGPRSILIRHRCPLRGLALYWQWRNHINLLRETEHVLEVTCWWFDWVRLVHMTVGILTKCLNWDHLYVFNYKMLKSTTKKALQLIDSYI